LSRTARPAREAIRADTSRGTRSIRALFIGEAVNKVTRFGAAVVLARALPLDDFGLVNIAIAAAGIATVATALGLPEIGARDVAVSPRDSAAIAGRIVAVRGVTIAAFAAVALTIATVARRDAIAVVVVASAMSVAMAWSADWLLRGRERMGALALATGAGGAFVLVGSLVVTQAASTAVAALAVFAAGEILVSALTWYSAKLPTLPRPTLGGVRALLRRSWPLALAALIVYSFYTNLDTILLGVTRSVEEAGLYSGPYRVFLALNVLAIFAGYAYLPVVAQAVAEGRAEAAMGALRGTLLPLACYGFVVLGIAELAGEAMLGALFGSPFREMEDVFIVLCLALPWYAVGFPVGYALIARDANRRFLLGAGVAGGLSIALGAALIPVFGAIGAAAATAVALAAACVVWLHAHWMLDRQVWPLMSLIVLVSAAGVVAAAVPDTRAALGAATLVTALLVFVRWARGRG
jgi:O-antigen/teichoic acid export membrane protein